MTLGWLVRFVLVEGSIVGNTKVSRREIDKMVYEVGFALQLEAALFFVMKDLRWGVLLWVFHSFM